MATCPFCEYEGATSSVEAHISGKTDEAHKGKQGLNYRGIIEESVGSDSRVQSGGSSGLMLVVATIVLAAVVLGSVGDEPAEPVEEPSENGGEWG